MSDKGIVERLVEAVRAYVDRSDEHEWSEVVREAIAAVAPRAAEIDRAWTLYPTIGQDTLAATDRALSLAKRLLAAEASAKRAEAVVSAVRAVRACFDDDYEEDEVLDPTLKDLFRTLEAHDKEAARG